MKNLTSGFFIIGFKIFISTIRMLRVRKSLKPDEVALMREINDLLAYAGPNPTSEERGDGIMDEYQFKERLLALKKDNIQIWKRY